MEIDYISKGDCMRRKIELVLILSLIILFGSGYSIQEGFADIEKEIWFSGQKWIVESSLTSPRGPGANYFSDSSETVWVDGEGWLHLKIRKEGKLKKWACSSVRSVLPADYGIHRFYLVGDVGNLDKNVVLGLFLYRMDTEKRDEGGEVDIEFSTWGLPKALPGGEIVKPDNNMQYVLWKPWKGSEEPKIADMTCYNIQTSPNQCSTHTLIWKPDLIRLDSCYGHLKVPKPENMMQSCVFRSTLQNTIQMPRQEDHMNIILNLWLNENVPFPSDKKEVEIMVKYEFEPLQ
jgi:hypothetical protein